MRWRSGEHAAALDAARTVDHHVAAVLERLGVDTRRAAGRRAAELGLVGRPA